MVNKIILESSDYMRHKNYKNNLTIQSINSNIKYVALHNYSMVFILVMEYDNGNGVMDVMNVIKNIFDSH